MFKKCVGTNTKPGCGETKLVEEFSIAYRNLCRACDNKQKRDKYILVKKSREKKKASRIAIRFLTK